MGGHAGPFSTQACTQEPEQTSEASASWGPGACLSSAKETGGRLGGGSFKDAATGMSKFLPPPGPFQCRASALACGPHRWVPSTQICERVTLSRTPWGMRDNRRLGWVPGSGGTQTLVQPLLKGHAYPQMLPHPDLLEDWLSGPLEESMIGSGDSM